MWRYDPKYDPDTKDLNNIPEEVQKDLQTEDFMWEGTKDLPLFKDVSIAWWQKSITLARQLTRTFALSLDLPETYFDKLITYSGSDGCYNYCPPLTAQEARREKDIQLSH